jgi:hypothetical protein
VSFTKARYAHLFPEHGEVLADRLDALIASRTSTPAAAIVAIGRTADASDADPSSVDDASNAAIAQ